MALESQFPLEFSSEFIEENKKIKFKNSKKGGRYSKVEKEKRRQEVYRLHFDYLYPARKIAEMMNVNRNTVNSDIEYWYNLVYKNESLANPEASIILFVNRLEIQRSRLREQLDKTKSFQEKMSIERLINEIDCKISNTYVRIAESTRNRENYAIEILNKKMKEKNIEEKYMKTFDILTVSEKARAKITKIIEQDRRNRHKS